MTQAEIMTTYLRWIQENKKTSEIIIGVNDQARVESTLKELQEAGIISKFDVGKHQATVTMEDK